MNSENSKLRYLIKTFVGMEASGEIQEEGHFEGQKVNHGVDSSFWCLLSLLTMIQALIHVSEPL